MEGSSAGEDRPRILLMGPSRAGKTSIKKVIFNKMSPHETLWLTPTTEVTTKEVSNGAFVQFEILDFPGKIDINKQALAPFLDKCGAIVFVLDAQAPEAYRTEVTKICNVIQAAQEMSKKTKFELFINKAEIYCDEKKTEILSNVKQAVKDELMDMKLADLVNVACQVTSIYDQSVFESFSKVVRNLVPEFTCLENLLNTLVQTCKMEKAYMFDKVSKICVAADSTFGTERHNELCSDMIDVFIDFSVIYGSGDGVAYDPESFSTIRLSAGPEKGAPQTILYLREVAPFVVLVCVIRQEDYDGKMGLIDYNFTEFRSNIDRLISHRGGALIM